MRQSARIAILFSPLLLLCSQAAIAIESHKFGGLADYYHHSLYGKKTASGEVLKKESLTAAHRTLPFGTRVHVVNRRSGKSCIVVINDRGPYTKSKVIDVSHAAATQLGLLQAGTADVACTVLKPGEMLPGKRAIVEKATPAIQVASDEQSELD